MIGFLRSSAAAICGLATSVLVAAFLAAVVHFVHLNLFGFALVIRHIVPVPAGALVVGLVAASGYYFGSVFFQVRPTSLLVLQILLVAGLAFVLTYYFEYETFSVDGVQARDVWTFGAFFDAAVRSTSIDFDDFHVETGALGAFGYVVIVCQVIALLAGGLTMYVVLLEHPACDDCKKYLRRVAHSDMRFDDPAALDQYRAAIAVSKDDAGRFAAVLANAPENAARDGKLKLTTSLHRCPQCRRQRIMTETRVHGDEGWEHLQSLDQRHDLPPNMDLSTAAWSAR